MIQEYEKMIKNPTDKKGCVPLTKKNIALIIVGVSAVSGLLLWLFLPKSTENSPTQAEISPAPALTVEIPQPQEEEKTTELEEEEEVEEETPSLRLNYLTEQAQFDLPLQGATAFASVPLSLRETPNGSLLLQIPHGEGFVILADQGEWWQVRYQDLEGFVFADYCLLNLPDVLPSAVYLNTNASSSVFHASYYPLPEVTGEKLYDAYGYNDRLEQEEFTSVVLYQTALKIAQVQQNAMKNGETLIINETYRPAEVQSLIVKAMTALSKSNSEVLEGITKPPWSMTWFISTGVSNHQRGYAIDCSLGKVLETEEKVTGDYVYTQVTSYAEYTMPTPIHELSYRSACMEYVTRVIEENVSENLAEVLTDTLSALLFLTEEESSLPAIFPGDSSPQTETTDSPAVQEDTESLPETELLPEPDSLEETAQAESEVPETPDQGLDDGFLELSPGELDAVPPENAENSENLEEFPELDLENPESEETEDSQPKTVTSWERAETMTDAADRLQDYFLAVGMSPIASEWWHFNDFNSGGSTDNVGKYVITGLYSQAPMAISAEQD